MTRLLAGICLALMLAPAHPFAAQQSYAAAVGTESNNQHKLVWQGGRLYFTYTRVVRGVPQVFVDVSADGRAWRSLGQASAEAGPATLSTLAVDRHGRVHVAWTDFSTGAGAVQYRQYDGRWGRPVRLSSNLPYAGYPSLDVDRDSRLHLVWYGIREASQGQPSAASALSRWPTGALNGPREPEGGICVEERENEIREKLEKIREARNGDWSAINAELLRKRLGWFEKNRDNLHLEGTDVRKAYTLFLIEYLGLSREEVPVVYEDERRIVWRSYNSCPVLEACRRGGFDTREVCMEGWERSVQALIEKINPKLRFSRNYDKIRPHAEYCEETIELVD